jgi:hypothetical protein
LVHERLHDADLLLVALRQPADRPVQVEAEPLGERTDALTTGSTPQRGGMAQRVAGGLAPHQRQLAREVADARAQVGPRQPWPTTRLSAADRFTESGFVLGVGVGWSEPAEKDPRDVGPRGWTRRPR